MFKTLTIIVACASSLWAQGQESKKIETDKGPLYYEVYGKGKTMLLLSGGPGLPVQMLTPLVDEFSSTYRIVALEQRGTGRSVPIKYDSSSINLKQAVLDIHTVIENQPNKKVILISHSFGSALALNYAVLHPEHVEKLVLIAAPPLKWGTSFSPDNRRARMTVAEMEANTSAEDSIRNKIATPVTFENHAKRYLRSMIFDAYKTDSYYNILSKGGPLNIEMNRLMAASMVKEYDIRQSIPGLVVPTLVITGRQDPSSIFSSVELEKLNHRYLQLHWIEKCGHYPFVEHPNTFFAIVKSFLTE